MSLKVKSVDRQEVLDLAALSVEGAAKDGGMIQADMEAHRLLDAHPDCQIPFEELRDTIARLAVAHNVGVEFGDRSYEQQDALGSRPREIVAAAKVQAEELKARYQLETGKPRKSAMTVSLLDAEHMSSLAGELANSGD